MPRKAKKWNQRSRITSALRRIWFYGPQRRSASKRAKDNGNFCEKCGNKVDKLQCDHKIPVVPLTGFDNWSNFIDRLFCESEYLAMICEDCHAAITRIQREQRKNKKSLTIKRK